MLLKRVTATSTEYLILRVAAHMLGGMLCYEKFLKKMCNLMRLGEYFDQNLYKNCFFLK